MRQLREAFGADVALERSLTGVRSEMNLKIRQLTEGLTADVALVVHLPVLLLKWIRQRPVTPRSLRVRAERATLRATVIVRGERTRRRVSVIERPGGGGIRVNGESRMMAEVKIVRACDQASLTPVDLHSRRGGWKLMTATWNVKTSTIRRSFAIYETPVVTSARGRRISCTVDRQRSRAMMESSVLMIETVRIGRR